jgi:hypothetical protein
LALAGCGTGANDSTTPDAAVTHPPLTEAPVAVDGPDARVDEGYDMSFSDGDVWLDESPSADAQLTVTDVRVGTHGDFDRVVFDLAGTGTPGWLIHYVPEALDDGSGEPVAVAGNQVVEVRLAGMAFPPDSGATEFSGDRVRLGGSAVTEVVYRYWFEGNVNAFIGVNGTAERTIHVDLLRNPLRLVVDIQH